MAKKIEEPKRPYATLKSYKNDSFMQDFYDVDGSISGRCVTAMQLWKEAERLSDLTHEERKLQQIQAAMTVFEGSLHRDSKNRLFISEVLQKINEVVAAFAKEYKSF